MTQSSSKTAKQATQNLTEIPMRDASALLYRCALGEHKQQYYLNLFTSFDAKKIRWKWNWMASLSALNWLLARGLWSTFNAWALLSVSLTVSALGMARLMLGWSNQHLIILLLILILISSVLWGAIANNVYYRACKGRILRAVASSAKLQQACSLLEHQTSKPNKSWLKISLLNITLGALCAICIWFLYTEPYHQKNHTNAKIKSNVRKTIKKKNANLFNDEKTANENQPKNINEQTNIEIIKLDAIDAKPPIPPVAPLIPSIVEPIAPLAPQAIIANKNFAVQIGIFSKPDNVQKIINTLSSNGMQVSTEKISNKLQNAESSLVRIRVGSYTTQKQAQEIAQRIRKLNLPAVIVHLSDKT